MIRKAEELKNGTGRTEVMRQGLFFLQVYTFFKDAYIDTNILKINKKTSLQVIVLHSSVLFSKCGPQTRIVDVIVINGASPVLPQTF